MKAGNRRGAGRGGQKRMIKIRRQARFRRLPIHREYNIIFYYLPPKYITGTEFFFFSTGLNPCGFPHVSMYLTLDTAVLCDAIYGAVIENEYLSDVPPPTALAIG